MVTTIRDIVGELFHDKDEKSGMYKKMNMMMKEDNQFSELLVDFASDFEGMIDIRRMLSDVREKKLITKEEKEGLRLEVTVYALALFLLYLEKNKMISILSKEKRIAKGIFMTFEKNLDKKDYAIKKTKQA